MRRIKNIQQQKFHHVSWLDGRMSLVSEVPEQLFLHCTPNNSEHFLRHAYINTSREENNVRAPFTLCLFSSHVSVIFSDGQLGPVLSDGTLVRLFYLARCALSARRTASSALVRRPTHSMSLSSITSFVGSNPFDLFLLFILIFSPFLFRFNILTEIGF